MTVKDLNIIYTDQEYQLLGGHAWIDVHTLTVHIMRVKDGVRVEVYPAAHDGVSEPLAECRAKWEAPAPESSTKVIRRYVR
jgi:hypothetical protein|tara:strand:- start:1245 stop:1487 length:243 start_codon:yes stop_codon:yes gene_type:complete